MSALLFASVPARALDLFTLWRQPQIPLRLKVGSWVEYQRQSLAGGRRERELLRIQCLAPGPGHPDAGWLLEIVPVQELAEPGEREPVPGEGVRVWVADTILMRRGQLLDTVVAVERWQDGVPTDLTGAQWRADPLVTDALRGDFQAESVADQGTTVRVIQDRSLTCHQFAFAAADTQAATFATGTLVQMTTIEVNAAVSDDIPLLGLAFAAERMRAESVMTPASPRFSPPPPQAKVETLECLGYGQDARPLLTGAAPGPD